MVTQRCRFPQALTGSAPCSCTKSGARGWTCDAGSAAQPNVTPVGRTPSSAPDPRVRLRESPNRTHMSCAAQECGHLGRRCNPILKQYDIQKSAEFVPHFPQVSDSLKSEVSDSLKSEAFEKSKRCCILGIHSRDPRVLLKGICSNRVLKSSVPKP